MTYLEKLRELNPLFDDKTLKDVVRSYCPFEWGLSLPETGIHCKPSCVECWNQEIRED